MHTEKKIFEESGLKITEVTYYFDENTDRTKNITFNVPYDITSCYCIRCFCFR